MRVRLTTVPDDGVYFESPYDQRFVEHFKQAISYSGRQWEPERKRWLVTALYVVDLLGFLAQQGVQIQDDRTPTTSMTAVPPMPDDLREAFDALTVAYVAPLCVAEAAFRAWSKYCHPDRGGDPQQFHKVNDAIAVVRKYLDPRPHPEKPESAVFSGQGRTSSEIRSISGSAAADSRLVEGIPCAAVLLGALVRRLQSGSADHYAVAIRVCRQGIESSWSHSVLRLHGAKRTRIA